jgi:glutathione S-transferase
MSSNQSTTITYFKGWGLAEHVRWLLASHPSTSDFSSFCLSNFEEFDALRTSGDLLFGQLPLLEIDGMKLVQSQACVRYVARRNGMAGKDQAEQARADMVVELIKDARLGVVKWPFSKVGKGDAKGAGEASVTKVVSYVGWQYNAFAVASLQPSFAPRSAKH